MTAQHRLDLSDPGTFVGARVVCLGTDADECHQWCAEGCEEECSGWPWIPPGTEVVAMAPPTGHRSELYAQDRPGDCRITDWINNCGHEDTYAGDEELLRWDEDGELQDGIVSGLIEVEWTGDDYVWSYPGVLDVAVLR